MKSLIIIPTYDELENLKKLIPKIFEQNLGLDILIIDDNSPDGTGQFVKDLIKKNNHLKIIERPRKLGLGSAYILGFQYGIDKKYDLIFEMDADFSHDPKYLKKFILSSEKYDLVLGSRWIQDGGVVGWNWFRYFASFMANLITRLLLGLKPRDITTGFRCYRRHVLEEISTNNIISASYAFQEEMIYRVQKAGFSIGEIPIIFKDRTLGESKMTKKEIWVSAKTILKVALRLKPERLFLPLIFVLGIIVRFIELGRRPFDGDEGLVALTVNSNFHWLLTKGAMDVQPFGYHILSFITSKIFGMHEWSMRLPSAIFGVLLIYVVYLLAKKIANARVAVLSSFIIAVSPYFLYYSQEARMYSILVFFTTLATYNLMLAVEKNKWINWLYYALSMIGAIYSQYLGLILLFAHGLALLIFYRKSIWRFILASIVSIGSLIFVYHIFLNQFTGRMLGENKSALTFATNLKGVIGAFYRFISGRLFLDITPEGIKSMLHDPLSFALFLLTLVLPPILAVIGFIKLPKSRLVITMYIIFVLYALLNNELGARSSRYLIILAPFYIIWIAAAIINYWPKLIFKTAAVVLFFILNAGLYQHYFVQVKSPGLDKIASIVDGKANVKDTIYDRGGFGGGESWALNFYSQKPHNIIDYYGDYKVGNLLELRKVEVSDKIKTLVKSDQSVWFFDNTYENKNFNIADIQTTQFSLGKDKEGQEIILWQFTK